MKLSLKVAALALFLATGAMAARTVIVSKTPTRTGITWVWTATDTVNGNACGFGNVTMLMAQNTTASPVNITIWAAAKADIDMTAPNRVVTIPASSQGTILVGTYYQQADGNIWIDAPTGVNLACFTSN